MELWCPSSVTLINYGVDVTATSSMHSSCLGCDWSGEICTNQEAAQGLQLAECQAIDCLPNYSTCAQGQTDWLYTISGGASLHQLPIPNKTILNRLNQVWRNIWIIEGHSPWQLLLQRNQRIQHYPSIYMCIQDTGYLRDQIERLTENICLVITLYLFPLWL